MTILCVALTIVTVWAIVAEIRFKWLMNRTDELTDIVLQCGHVVTDALKQLEDDGR